MKMKFYRWPGLWQVSLFVGPYEFRVASNQIAFWKHLGNYNFRTFFNVLKRQGDG